MDFHPRMSASEHLIVYTDGSCLGNPGPGGWAWAVPHGPFGAGPDTHTTNQRMEVNAVIQALDFLFSQDSLPQSVTVISDSTYVIKCFQDKWHAGWLRRGWKNSQGQPVANRDLWEQLFALALEPKVPITWKWVKGHSGDFWNDVVDQLALTAATSQQPSSGTR